MSTQLMFYSKAIPVSSQKHGDLSVKTGGDYAFASSVNSVPLTAVEFRRATPEYAVVFAGEGDAIMPVAIMGVEADHNVFVKEDGSWDGKYVPAFVRRYPFVFSSSDDAKTFTLCVDEAFSGCNREGRGERLFDADGERTQYLQTVLNFVNEYQAQFQRTRAFCARLKELDLLQPMHAQFTVAGGQQRNLTGFMVVDRSKLKEIDGDVLAKMAKDDELELIYLHLHSMQNLGTLLDRIGATPGQGSADSAELSEGMAEVEEGAQTH